MGGHYNCCTIPYNGDDILINIVDEDVRLYETLDAPLHGIGDSNGLIHWADEQKHWCL